jgi:hypothetical protein
MTMFDFNDAEGQRSGFSGSLIPEGTIAIVTASLRPGGGGTEGILRNSDSGASMLDFEFTIQGGEFDRRKILNLYVVDGVTEGHEKAKNISKSALRAMLEAARNIDPSDTSPAAIEARKIAGYADLNGLTFPIEIGEEKGNLKDKTAGPNSERWPDKNIIRSIITPDREEYASAGVSAPAKAAVKVATATGAAKPSAGKPSWAQ